MKAICVDQPGGPEKLRIVELAEPEPGPGELLVRVFAAGVNRADTVQRRGHYPPPPGESEILGLEFAGEVIRAADGAADFATGDRVFGLLAGGGYAEQVKVHHALAMPIPDSFSYEKAAAVPEVFFTAYENLFTQGQLSAGESVLIHAGASGVGTAAIQLARRQGSRVFVTVGTSEKLTRARALGAESGVIYPEEDFGEGLRRLTEGTGVDVILDFIGAPYLERNLDLLKIEGRLILLGVMGGSESKVDLRTILTRRLRVIGRTLRALPLAEKIAITERFKENVLPDLISGKLEPVIDRVFPLDEVRQAHEYMEANRNIGKILLRL